MKLPFELSRTIAGEAGVDLDAPIQQAFAFIGEQFFSNYPKWAVEVTDFEVLDDAQICVGAKAKQIRHDNGNATESVFEITEFQPPEKLVLQGLSAPYKQSYLLSENIQGSRLTFRFELLELEVFMRPFEKLIRYAIEEGAENTTANIKQLLNAECAPCT